MSLVSHSMLSTWPIRALAARPPLHRFTTSVRVTARTLFLCTSKCVTTLTIQIFSRSISSYLQLRHSLVTLSGIVYPSDNLYYPPASFMYVLDSPPVGKQTPDRSSEAIALGFAHITSFSSKEISTDSSITIYAQLSVESLRVFRLSVLT